MSRADCPDCAGVLYRACPTCGKYTTPAAGEILEFSPTPAGEIAENLPDPPRPRLTLARLDAIVYALETVAATPAAGLSQPRTRKENEILAAALAWATTARTNRRRRRRQIHIQETEAHATH